MNKIQNFTKILRLRNSTKKLQQLSWTISQLDKRYDIDEMNQKDYPDLISAYLDLIPQLQLILDELLVEKSEKENKL